MSTEKQNKTNDFLSDEEITKDGEPMLRVLKDSHIISKAVNLADTARGSLREGAPDEVG